MPYSSKWLRFHQAAEELFNSRYALHQDKETLVNDLKQALVSPNDRQTALELLAYMYPDVTVLMPLLHEVLDTAIDSGNYTAIELAREVLAKYQADPLIRSNIPLIVTRYLADHDDWHYRRIAELYVLLNYEEEITSFLLLCQASPNVEIQEIRDDFTPS
ncbi:MAG: hypothetical protein EOO60_09015 [Hymenobacter sp.]|nr:MAG: hypothetical protein EOO60_09015 [Hymenobacter sp.]